MITNASETWALKESMKRKLLIAERTILRRIFVHTKDIDGTWRTNTNDELNNLITNKNIVNYLKGQRLSWFNHVHRMTNDTMVNKL